MSHLYHEKDNIFVFITISRGRSPHCKDQSKINLIKRATLILSIQSLFLCLFILFVVDFYFILTKVSYIAAVYNIPVIV
jgi:hypothetical protein